MPGCRFKYPKNMKYRAFTSLLRWENLTLGYTDPQGAVALRREICALYKAATPEDVIVAAPQELISMAFQAMLQPGDHIVATFPGYQSLYELAQTMGCSVSF